MRKSGEGRGGREERGSLEYSKLGSRINHFLLLVTTFTTFYYLLLLVTTVCYLLRESLRKSEKVGEGREGRETRESWRENCRESRQKEEQV